MIRARTFYNGVFNGVNPRDKGYTDGGNGT